MPSKIVSDCSKTLAGAGWNIAFVESATAGRMCSEFSLTANSGEVLRGGISCYEVFIKEDIIKVPHDLIKEYTPESAEVTQSLAENAIVLFKSDVLVAVTGLTAPGGSETPEKPVGTMFLHIITPLGHIADRQVFEGSAEEIILKAVDHAARLIINHLSS